MPAVEARAAGRQDWTQWEPLTGVIAVLLWLIGAFTLDGAADPPDDDASPLQVLAYYQDDAKTILIGGFLFMVGGAFFIWFLGSLRSRLLAAEGGVGRLSSLAFAGGLATAIFLIATPGLDVAAAIDEDHLSPTSADALHDGTDAFFVGAEVSAIVLTLAVGVLAIRTRALPKVFGWLSVALAVWLLIAPIGWAGLLLGFPLWVLAASILLVLPPRAPAAAPREEPLAPVGG